MLELVHELVVERPLEERGRVPDPQREHMDGPCDRREGDDAPRCAQPARAPPPEPEAPAPAEGSAHSVTVTGSPRTMRGAATIMSSMCCTMCTAKSDSPTASTGETQGDEDRQEPAGTSTTRASLLPRARGRRGARARGHRARRATHRGRGRRARSATRSTRSTGRAAREPPRHGQTLLVARQAQCRRRAGSPLVAGAARPSWCACAGHALNGLSRGHHAASGVPKVHAASMWNSHTVAKAYIIGRRKSPPSLVHFSRSARFVPTSQRESNDGALPYEVGSRSFRAALARRHAVLLAACTREQSARTGRSTTARPAAGERFAARHGSARRRGRPVDDAGQGLRRAPLQPARRDHDAPT